MADPVTISAAIGAGASVLGAGTSAVAQSSLNKKTREFNKEEAAKQRAWNESMAEKQNAWNYQMWLEQNEYNSPSAQLQRLLDAGLNPLYYGLDGTGNAGALTAAQPLGYDRANMDNQPNPFGSFASDIGSAAQLALQGKSLAKDIELKNAQIDQMKENTKGIALDNEWKDKTLEARSSAEQLKNDLTRKQMSQIDSQIQKNEQDIKESIARTKNEEERTGLIIAQKMLAESQRKETDARTKEILSLLPYRRLLMEAQTEAQKASAAASWTHQAYEKGLIDSGYLDKLVSDLEASIRQKNSAADANDAMKAVNAWKLAVKNGNAFDISSINENDILAQGTAVILNSIFNIISTASEAVGGGLSGFFK